MRGCCLFLVVPRPQACLGWERLRLTRLTFLVVVLPVATGHVILSRPTSQRNQVCGWEMRGHRPEFHLRNDLSNLELPRGTVLEVEYAQELEGEVSTAALLPQLPLLTHALTRTQGSGQRKRDVVNILDVLSIFDDFLGKKPLKERLGNIPALFDLPSQFLSSSSSSLLPDSCMQRSWPKW